MIKPSTIAPVRAAVQWDPQSAQPTGAHVVGDMYMTASGDLMVCTSAGTPGTWSRVGRKGVTDGSNAAAGDIGEQVISTVAIAGAVSLTNNVVANITSISLTAGDWDVSATGWMTGSSTGTMYEAGISTTSGSLPTAPSARAQTPTTSTAAADSSVTVKTTRISISATTTVFLATRALFSAGTIKAYGEISARRVR